MDQPNYRLPAVWLADIVGHAAPSAQHEVAARAPVQSFQELAHAVAAAHEGRVVKLIGDAVLAQFGFADSAVRAAVALQERFAAAARVGGWDAQLRIAVHTGEVSATDAELHGDAIETALRLRDEARPGKVIVSEDVWRQLRKGPEFRFVSLHGATAGAQVFEVLFGERAARARRAEKGPAVVGGHRRREPRRSRRMLVLSGVGLTVGVIAISVAGGDGGTPAADMAASDSTAPDSLASATDAATGAFPAGDSLGEAPSGEAATTAADSAAALGPPTRPMSREAVGPIRTFIQRFAFRLSSRPLRDVLAQYYPGAPEPQVRALLQMNEVMGAPGARFQMGGFQPRGMRADTALIQLELLASVPGGPEYRLLLDGRIAPSGDGFRFTDLRPSPPEP